MKNQNRLPALVEKTLRHGTKILVAAFMLWIVVQALPARAGGGIGGFAGATEITQIMNNAELAIQSVEQQLQSVELIEQTYLGRLQQLKSSIGQYTAPFQKAYDAYQKVKAVHDKLTTFKGKLEGLDVALEDRFKQFSASSLDWNSYTQREALLIKDGNARAIAQVQANQEVLASTKEAMEGYQKAAQAMEASEGTHQATRLLGSQLTLLGGDLNKLIAITAQANSVRGLERQEQSIDRDRAKNEADRIRKLQTELDARRRAELKAIIDGVK